MSALLAASSAFGPVNQDYLFEARQMQALSFAVHIPLVAFGIAMPAIVVFTEWRWHRTGNPLYRTLAKRWSKLMIALFAVGVVTGTILSFELGLLWPNFMATFGDVFGLAFGLEGFSFFLEAIFMAIYVYGWDRMSPRKHLLTGIPVIITGMTGSTFVIAVNAWMNNPSGFRMQGGEAVDIHPWSALFGNNFLWHELVHMYVAGFIVVGFLLGGAYSVAWLKGNRSPYMRTALLIPLTVAAVAAPVQLVVGDWAARTVAEEQPIKLAALEGLYKTTKGASEHLGGWYTDGKVEGGIAIPDLLSFLAFHNPHATVQGLETVPPDDRPPINVERFAFQIMVGIGTGLAALAAWFLYFRLRLKRLPETKWFYRAVIVAGPLSVVALISGWVTTEVGRQPWVVYGVMRTEEAVTGADGILFGYGTLVAVYIALAIATAWVLRRLARAPIDEEPLPGGLKDGKPNVAG